VKQEAIKKKIDKLEKELNLLKQELYLDKIDPSTVVVPR
jgi:hypothetical protein